jgi:galactose-1-phosphate uridylyltransferase
MLSKHLENFHKTKAKLNFCFQNADSSQTTQPATSTNPFTALEAEYPEAEDAMDNLEEMREGWTF